MATFSQRMTGGFYPRPVVSDNPNARLAWEETGVVFTPVEAEIIAPLTNETTLDGCVQLGAVSKVARLWGHTEMSGHSYDDTLEESWVDDFEEAIAVFPQITIECDDGKIRHPFCQFSYWDDGCIHQSDGSLFGLVERDYYLTLSPAQ